MSDERDCIHIEQLEVLGRVGVTENERAHSQRLVLNITTWLRRPFSELGDDISETANYSAIAQEARTVTESAPHQLIETLADSIAQHLMEVFRFLEVRVEVRKFVLPDAAFVSVVAHRKSN